MPMVRRLRLMSLATLLLALPAPALALLHRIDLWVQVVDQQIVVQACFSHGEPVANGKVKVLAPDESVLTEGLTDAKGKFAFTLAHPPEYVNVIVDAGGGHMAREKVTRHKLVRRTATQTALAPTSIPSGGRSATPTSVRVANPQLAEITVTLARMESTLLDLQEQLDDLSKPRTAVSLERVLTGIGFILGLTGVAMYCMARRK